jgi:adenosylhomocysteine nucleosidase
MMLRWLVANYIRQTAREKISEAVSEVARQQSQADREGSDVPELPPCDIAFMFATAIESDGLVNLLESRVTTRCASYVEHAGRLGGRPLVIAESGVGAKAAAKATEDVITMSKPSWIVSAGFAGALTEGIGRGHVLMADDLVDPQDNHLSVGFKIDSGVVEATRGLHLGRLLTIDRLISTPDQRRELGGRYSAVACDMETMSVAEVCRRRQVRFLSVRVITDAVDDRLPPEIERLTRQKTIAGKLGAATGAVFKRPGTVKDFWRVRENALKASDRLAKFLSGVVPQLNV